MKKFTEKLCKLIVTVVCASMIFQTVGIHAMATEIGDGVEPVPTTEFVDDEQVAAYEAQLKEIGQNALNELVAKCLYISNAESNMDGVIVKAQGTYDSVAAAKDMRQEVLNEYNKFSQYAASAQDILSKAQADVELAKTIVANANNSFNDALANAQIDNAAVTGAEGSVLLQQATTIVGEYEVKLAAVVAKNAQVQQLQNSSWEVFTQKTVSAYFFVLNRGLDIPEGIFGETSQYSRSANGELYSGVSEGDYSYLPTYQKGQILFGDVAKHLKSVPTRDEINAVLAYQGDQLAEDETIEWYGIKRCGGSMHVDGRIVKIQSDDNNDDANEGNNNNDTNEGNNNDDTNEGNNDDNNDDTNEGNNNDDTNEGNNNDDTNEGNNNDDTNEGNNNDNNDDTNDDNNDDTNEGNNDDNNDDANEGNNDDNNDGTNEGNNDDANVGNNDDANVGNNNDGANEGNNDDANVGNNDDANVGNNDANNGGANEGNDENNGTDEELTTIEEEEVPLASTITDMTVIEDEETPLASGIADVCKTHWIILLLIMLYVAVQTGCIVSRNKKIKQMEEDLNNIAM